LLFREARATRNLQSETSTYVVVPESIADVIPRNDSDEESLKDFSLPLEMTVWTDFQGLFE
jgi:hypothetical protein